MLTPAPITAQPGAPVATQPDTNLVTAPQAVVQPSASLPPVLDMSNPTVQALVESARAEEKQKLYAEQTSLKSQVAELRAKLDGKLTPDEKQLEQLREVQQQLQATTNQITQLQAAMAESDRKHAAESAQLKLQAYLDRRLREEASKGTKMLSELIGGSTEQEVEDSIQLSIQEHERLRVYYAAEAAASVQPTVAGPLPLVSAMAPPVVATTTMVTPPGPSAFPTVPNAQAAAEVSPGTAGFVQKVADVTSPDAVRSGVYAQHRKTLLAGIRQGAVPPSGVPFANTPRTHVNTVQHGVVVQPQGNPTLPAVNPHVAVVPPQPTPNPPSSASPTPTVPSPGDFRAAAIASAQRGLQNPRSMRAAVVGAQPPTHSEYQPTPTMDANFDGGHPMAYRNSP